MRLRLTVIACGALIAGCWSPSPEFDVASPQGLDDAKGTLVITLSDTKSRYEATLVSGSVQRKSVSSGPAFDLIRKEQKQRRYSVPSPDGYQLREPSALSPNGKFLTSAMVVATGDTYAPANTLGIFEFPSGTLIAVFKAPASRFIDSVAWSPNSDRIAALTATTKSGKSPGDILSAVSGHPVSYNSFYLDVVNLKGKPVGETKLASDLQAGFSHVSWQ